MKTDFEIEKGFLEIWTISKHNSEVFVRIVVDNTTSSLIGKDLKLVATNILKAIEAGNKKLTTKKIKNNEVDKSK